MRAAANIAFVRITSTGTDIFVMNDDGSGLTNLTNHPASDWYPKWSTLGGRIAFMSDRAAIEIHLMKADGSRIAFVCDRDGNNDIFMVSLCNRVLTKLTADPASDVAPSWSVSRYDIINLSG